MGQSSLSSFCTSSGLFYPILQWECNHSKVKALCRDLSSNTPEKSQSLVLGPHTGTNTISLGHRSWQNHKIGTCQFKCLLLCSKFFVSGSRMNFLIVLKVTWVTCHPSSLPRTCIWLSRPVHWWTESPAPSFWVLNPTTTHPFLLLFSPWSLLRLSWLFLSSGAF